ncbi:FAD/NAD(P)-binding domain-containing protein [Laetiporus sulphureus 93-53]|uniref:FAD/NAD(P)-binding domain-containing protein n=1 Tax=Laetiporus sulphureus 93-53 TaxID=1314785 RepID=A0A165BZJ6_9APHY|nr:FAD/NAD(P)-binding domain-containing protein [Laetiporus sulphureus 93-53]KZT01935.1 FAD/NAD(P)-binding domain-containing protein [Laetiporus sulphureus 93-53]
MSALDAERRNIDLFLQSIVSTIQDHDVKALLSPMPFLRLVFNSIYILIQALIIWLFKPPPPPDKDAHIHYRGRIAVIGAGLTGVSSAAHAVAHGFDVVLFEQDDAVGGIWAHVNKTSGLQLNSMLYRFHPAVLWSSAFPKRDEILRENQRIWREYRLKERTRLSTRVTSVRRATLEELDNVSEDELDPAQQGHARWIVNDGEDDVFDAVVVTVGTCGAPRWVGFKGMPPMEYIERRRTQSEHANAGKQKQNSTDDNEGLQHDEEKSEVGSESGRSNTQEPYPPVKHTQDDGESVSKEDLQKKKKKKKKKKGKSRGNDEQEKGDENVETFEGTLLHSSQLDDAELEGKHVVVIGSGASGVEAIETALQRGASDCVMIARDDKWIIPRNVVLGTLISAQPFGREMPLSFVWEKIVTAWNYHGVEDLTPAHLGLFEGTPVVNDEFLSHIRAGRCRYVRGDTQCLTRDSVRVSVRGRWSRPGDEGEETEFPAGVVVLATGFKKPDIAFLPKDLFPEGYERPNLYLQNFATEDWSVLMTNSAYISAIGTVGHFHIGIYMRILLTFLMDKDSRPTPKDMKLWVDALRFVKRGARGGALGFFTYMELTIWLVLFHIFRLDRLKWLFFIMQGWGVRPVVQGERAECAD